MCKKKATMNFVVSCM